MFLVNSSRSLSERTKKRIFHISISYIKPVLGISIISLFIPLRVILYYFVYAANLLQFSVQFEKLGLTCTATSFNAAIIIQRIIITVRSSRTISNNLVIYSSKHLFRIFKIISIQTNNFILNLSTY